MRDRILLIGRKGQIGRELNLLLPALGDVTALDRSQIDLSSRKGELRDMIRRVRPDVIVNAAAYTAVENAESDAAEAHTVNAEAPGIMAEEAKAGDALFVHYSTDYVFNGAKQKPYVEDDEPNPLNVYGRTKLEGERAVQASSARYLILRTAWIYSIARKNFMLAILRRATQLKELKVVTDEVGAPTSAREVAAATLELLSGVCRGNTTVDSGIYHITAAGQASRYDFASAILQEVLRNPPTAAWFSAATNQQPLIADRVLPATTDENPRVRRPPYSVLSNLRLENTFGIRLPDWQIQLRSVLADRATQVFDPQVD
jgi:dTDP-4-dehydrorhamnose reductase